MSGLLLPGHRTAAAVKTQVFLLLFAASRPAPRRFENVQKWPLELLRRLDGMVWSGTYMYDVSRSFPPSPPSVIRFN